MNKLCILSVALLAVLGACTGGNQFKVAGNVEGAPDSTTLYLEVSSNGAWITIDSATTADGDFAFAQTAPQFPNIYRLRCDDRSVYFPIDSIETLTVTTKMATFDTEFNVEGSEHAKQVMDIEKTAIKNVNATPQQIAAWKDQLTKQILVDPSGIVAYYIINKYVNDAPIFNPSNDKDMKIIGAVANAFNSFKPNDPRTAYLVQMTIQAQQRRRIEMGTPADGAKIEAEMVNVIDIKLQDINGKEQSLAAEATKGKVVLLNFTMYDQQFSPAYNKTLNEIYAQYSGKVIIYQVGLDANISDWRSAAKNLPWIAVYDANGENSVNVVNYNVNRVPVTFIINKQGEIVQRNENVLTLKSDVAKYL